MDTVQTQHRCNGKVYDITLTEYIEVPCGKCEECKATQARQKAVKAMAEANTWEHNEVINLTYNNEHLPMNTLANGKKVATLRYSDVQKFKKSLLKYYKEHYNQTGLKFMCACEYGEKYQRPHYHLIMFNMECKDKEFWCYTKKGEKQFRSKEIEQLWKHGNVTLGEVTPNTIHYVANYCVKKFKGRNAKGYYKQKGIEPESVKSSNQRGLGALYFDKHKAEYMEHGKINVGTEHGIQTIGTNAYFDKLLANEYGDKLLEEIKTKRRKLNQQRETTRAFITGITVEEQREVEHKQFVEKIKSTKQRKFKELGQT